MPLLYQDPPHIQPLRRAYAVARCQAKYRNESWELTWEEWRDLWLENNQYLRKGRGSNDLALVRISLRKPWRWDNVQIEVRRIHLVRIVEQKMRERRRQSKR